jgi:hypothetical protein
VTTRRRQWLGFALLVAVAIIGMTVVIAWAASFVFHGCCTR